MSRLDGLKVDRTTYGIMMPGHETREQLQNKLNNLKLKTGMPIYSIIISAVEMFEQGLKK